MLEVISTLGAGFVKNLDDAFGVLPDCQPSRGFFNFNVRRYFAGSTSCSAEKKKRTKISEVNLPPEGVQCFVEDWPGKVDRIEGSNKSTIR